MTCNVGGVEQPIRVAVGILLIGIGALAAGAILLLTAAIGFCPLTALLGINTCAAKPGTKK